MNLIIKKIVSALVVAMGLILLAACSEPENGSQTDVGNTEEDVQDQTVPATWPEGYIPHEQSDECLDRYTDYHPGSGWQPRLTISADVFGGPRCTREEDGFGGYCDEEEGVVDPYYYFYCDDPEWQDSETGDTILREEPCIWWFKAEEVGEDCEYTMVCVPEDRLVEMNWPDDVSFDHHETFGVNFAGCN